MSFEKNDQALKTIFKKVSLKEPPHVLLEDFETEVVRKIRLAAWLPVLRIFGIGLVSLGFTAILILSSRPTSRDPLSGFPAYRQAGGSIKPGMTLKDAKQSSMNIKNTISDLQLKEIAEEVSKDLLLLQMLGEDEEFNVDFKLMDFDMEILTQPTNPQVG